ncbi:phosphatase PAP2 family protein [Mucilaginibacter gynuensis]|uniref:Phosphatase PAP2 family protein n=2 Tax=Mucilaginibacter gynuensis TaxID=1302236 RepID=A0ABP8FWM4_9SPHI
MLALGVSAQHISYADSTVNAKLLKDTLARHNSVLGYIPPAVFITYGLLSFPVKAIRQIDYNVYNDMQADHPGFKTKADNYLQYATIVAVYGFNAAGVKGKHRFVDRTALLVLSEVIFGGTTFIGKRVTNRTRPSNGDNYSFPSGHTGNAFLAAEFMFQEYGDVSPWYGIAGYSVAATTGILRVYNNAHWFSDVVAGAGGGILSAKVAYLIYPYIRPLFSSGKDDKNSMIIIPTYQNSTFGLTLVKNL